MKKALSWILLTALCLTACSLAAAEQEPLRVMTSFYPLHVFVQNILKDVEGVELHNLTHPSTGCLHDYQLLASDMRSLAGADILIINGGGMESFLDTAVAQFPQLQVVDSSQGIELIAANDLLDDKHPLEGQDEAPAAESPDHEDADAHEGHEHGEYNAHIWLDPRNARQMTLTIAQALAERLPDQAELIDRNAQAYAHRLSLLHEELATQLGRLKHRDIVTFHEAFPYFARAYGLHVVAVVALEPDEALTPAMLSALVDKVRDHGLPPLFTEPQYEDRAARAVAQETGARLYELNPIVTGDGAPDAYERDMRENARVLLEALGEQD